MDPLNDTPSLIEEAKKELKKEKELLYKRSKSEEAEELNEESSEKESESESDSESEKGTFNKKPLIPKFCIFNQFFKN